MYQYGQEFGHTLDNRFTIAELADKGKVYGAIVENPDALKLALSREYTAEIRVEVEEWRSPAGAFGEDSGPG